MLQKYIVLIYLLIVLLPVIGLQLRATNYLSCEKRELAEYPDFNFSKEYSKSIDNYFRDHFGFRNLMTHVNSKIKFHLFNSSTSTDHVVIGKQDWLYYTAKDDHIMASFSRTNKFSKDGLIFMTGQWNKTKEELRKTDIDFYLAVWPNKSSIYPEYLPQRMLLQKRNNDSRLEQAVNHLQKTNSNFQIIDPTEELLKEKNKQPLYCKLDSHWNEYGAFIAYTKLMKEMGLPSYKESDFNINWKESTDGDLKDALGICNDDTITELLPRFTLKDESVKVSFESFDEKKMRYYSNSEGNVNKRILVFRDSYTSALIPFLNLHFKESYFVWKKYDSKLIEEIQPDIVLDSKVERYFF